MRSIAANNDTKASITIKASLEETLDDWFDSHGIALTKLRSQRKDSDDVRLDYAKGEFKPCCFDKDEDGNKLIKQYCAELALVDERFENTVLIFDTDKTFRIASKKQLHEARKNIIIQ